ncbi:MAG TPA: ABC transporter permease [Streptosporangiaceae bacterium]|nr:ABC transporter permease [Streptosporangiaceae bacterium]
MAMPVTVSAGQPAGLPEPVAGARGRAGGRLAQAIRSNRKATAGVILLGLFAFVSLFPQLLAPDNPNAIIYGQNLGPSASHWFGTTSIGQDVYAQVIYGTRAVLILAISVGLLTTVIAAVIGVAAAYIGGATDSVLNLITDILLVIPLFPLLIAIAAYLHNAGNLVMIAILTGTGWSYTARQLRSQAQSLRGRDFLMAARVRGERTFYIIMVEIIPTMTSLLLACFLGNALYAVLAASGLQFLGLGDPNLISWGTTLYHAQNDQALQNGQYLWAIAPGACIALLGAAFALLNYAFDEVSNPALRPMRTKALQRRRARHGTRNS